MKNQHGLVTTSLSMRPNTQECSMTNIPVLKDTHFIPKKNSPEYIGKTYGLAYEFGQRWVSEGKMSGYNVGMNIGRCAGQTVFWPHIHFIPRHDGDADPKGGMRYAHPGADHREHY